MTSENTTLGKRIMALRKAAGMTQEQLAEKLGVSPQAVSKWENDISCPDITAIPLIAAIFGVSADELLGITQAAPQTKPEPQSKNITCHPNGMWLGILMIVLGAAFLISRITNFPFAIWDILWPAALLGIGIAWFIEHRSLFCLGIAGTGLYFLLNNLGTAVSSPIDLNIIWSVALVLLGLDMVLRKLFPSVFRSKKPHHQFCRFGANPTGQYDLSNGFLSSETVFGEKHYAVESCEISGADIETVFGSCTMDLSDCTFAADAALKVEVVFGHLSLILPPSVKAVFKSESAFSGTNIAGVHDADAVPIVILGKAAFSGLDICYK